MMRFENQNRYKQHIPQESASPFLPVLMVKTDNGRAKNTKAAGLRCSMNHYKYFIPLLLLAAALRFAYLDAQSFWNDEGNSARLSERTIPLIIEGTASDIHPPFYYLILRGWRELVGETEFGLRSFSAFVGVGLVAVTIALGQTIWERPATGTWVAGLFVALNPILIYYSQEARMYALLPFLALLATLFLWHWLILPSPITPHTSRFTPHVSRFTYPAVYTFTLAAGLYTHYFFPTIILVHGLLLIPTLHRQSKISNLKSLTAWGMALLATALLYLPWLPIFLRQTSGRATTSSPPLQFFYDSTTWLLLGDFISSPFSRYALLAAATLLILTFILHHSSFILHHSPLILLLAFLTPISLMLLRGLTKEPFYKFMLMAVPILALLLGQGVALAWRRKGARGVGVVAAAILLLAMGAAYQQMRFNPTYARADYRAIAQRIAQENHPNAGVILNAANQWEVFTYYHQGSTPTYPIPRGGMDQAHIQGELDAIARQHDRLYAIFWGEAEQDPNRFVERWLDANCFKAVDEWVGDVRLVMYAVPGGAAAMMQTPLNLPFGSQITLLGYTLNHSTLHPGDIITLTLFWQTENPLTERYKIFLHLVDSHGQLITQRDSEPGGGLALTTIWPPGQPISDNHGLLIPADLPAGQYTLLLGLYDLTNPALRLPIPGQDAAAYPLAVLEIK